MVFKVGHLSYSSVSSYLMCARSWRYRYIDRIETPVAAALSFGSAFHDAIKSYLESRNTKDASDLFSNYWKYRVGTENIDYGDDTPESLKELGCGMMSSDSVVDALSSITPRLISDIPVLEKRVEFNVEGVPVPIIGFIDLINDCGIPVDFKTSAKSWYGSRADDDLQPSFYLEALRQSDEMPVDGEFLYYIFTKTKQPKVQILSTSRNENQLEWMKNTVRDVWHGIEFGVFPPNGVGGWKCSKKYCEYWDVCKG